MGRPKMLLPWGTTTVLGHLIAQWQKIGASQIAVVCAADDKAISEELNGIGFADGLRITNTNPLRGMFSSIQCAARWSDWEPAIAHWAIALGDQPHLADETLRAVIEFSASHPNTICQPTRTDRPRHPVLLPKRLFEALTISREQNLKEFLGARASEVRLVQVSDPGLDFDLDTPADYEEAQRFLTAIPRS